jgi:hypothetical protein
MATILIAALLVSTSWWGPPGLRRVRFLYWQHRCLAYTSAPSQLVHDSNASKNTLVPPEWMNFYALYSPPGFNSEGTVFLHEMSKPNGERRLVAVDLTHSLALTDALVLVSRVFAPGTMFQPPQEMGDVYFSAPVIAGPDGGKVFAGSLDPSDASHFTFRTDDGSDVVTHDGWLQNDDTVRFSTRRTTTKPK